MSKTYKSVWDALCDDPEEAEDMKRRSDCLILIKARLHSHPGKAAARAEHFELPAEQVRDLVKGRIDKFSLPELIAIARKIGIMINV